MAKMKCTKCGDEHDPDELELGFDQPDMFLEIPRRNRQERARGNDDLCEIDGRHFFIRGFLEIPRTDSPRTFAFGMWVKVSRNNYYRYLELWEDEQQAGEPSFAGQLANQIPGYPETVGLRVSVRMLSPTSRPTLHLTGKNHPLAREQQQGITGARLLEILSPYLH
jgi:hypothetical protein